MKEEDVLRRAVAIEGASVFVSARQVPFLEQVRWYTARSRDASVVSSKETYLLTSNVNRWSDLLPTSAVPGPLILSVFRFMRIRRDVVLTDADFLRFGHSFRFPTTVTDATISTIVAARRSGIVGGDIHSVENAPPCECHFLGCRLLTDAAMKSLMCFPHLTELDLFDLPGITAHAIVLISEMKQLRSLSVGRRLTAMPFMDQTLGPLASLPELTSLTFLHLPLVDLRFLPGCEALQTLRVVGAQQLSDAAIENVSKLPVLTALTLTLVSALTSCSSEYFGEMSRLTSLSLRECTNVDDIVSSLHKCPQLTHCDCDNSDVSDAGASSLSLCRSMEILSLAGAEDLTDDGLDAIAALPKLKELTLDKCNEITDDGVIELFDRCLSLRRLSLESCNGPVTMVSVRAAKKRRRDLRVKWPDGIFDEPGADDDDEETTSEFDSAERDSAYTE